MVIRKKKLVLCLISIGCVLLLCLTAAWYMFGVKHILLPDTLEVPDEVLQEAFTGKIQEYKGTRYISYYLPQDEAVKSLKRMGLKLFAAVDWLVIRMEEFGKRIFNRGMKIILFLQTVLI